MIISDNEKCQCCSGKLYKDCCKQYIDCSYDDFNNAMEHFEYIKAYNMSIAMLTKYLMYINAHTIPLLKDKNPLGKMLYEVDIKAVEELTNNIFGVLKRKKIKDNLDERFWKISQMMQCVEWKNLFQFYTIVYCDWFEKVQIHEYISQIEITDETDTKLLEIVFSNLGYKYGIGRKIEIANLIVQKSNTKFERLQYKFAIALEYFIANDIDSSKKYADEVLIELDNYVVDNMNIYEVNKTADIYFFTAGILSRKEYYEKALELYLKCEDFKEYNESGYAMLYNRIAYVYFNQHLYEKAVEHFEKAYKYEKNNFSLIHMSENYLYLNLIDKAEECLQSIDMDNIEKDIVDYYIAKAELYICADKKEETKQLIEEMQELNICKIPYFNDIFSKLIMEMQKNTGYGNSFLDIVKNIRKYLILQPNINGIGININQMLEDVFK